MDNDMIPISKTIRTIQGERACPVTGEHEEVIASRIERGGVTFVAVYTLRDNVHGGKTGRKLYLTLEDVRAIAGELGE